MAEKDIQFTRTQLTTSPRDWGRAQLLVRIKLGPFFFLRDGLPPTVGVKGDERVDGEAVSIDSLLDPEAHRDFYNDHIDEIALLSQKLCADFPAITRVLVDIKPIMTDAEMAT